MTQFDDVQNNESILETFSQHDITSLEHKQSMLYAELYKFNDIDSNNIVPTKIITNILDDLSTQIIIQTPEHNMTCHSRSHGSTGGGTGFGKSHDKRC